MVLQHDRGILERCCDEFMVNWQRPLAYAPQYVNHAYSLNCRLCTLTLGLRRSCVRRSGTRSRVFSRPEVSDAVGTLSASELEKQMAKYLQ